MNIFHLLFHWKHNWMQTVNETIGPKNVDPSNPSGWKYPLIRECVVCGRKEIFRDTQWTKKTSSYGGGEIIEKTPSGWLRLARINETIRDHGRKIKVGYSCFSETKKR